MEICCGLSREELTHYDWVSTEGICKALKADRTECNCPYSVHPTVGTVQLQIQQTLNGIDRRLESLDGKFSSMDHRLESLAEKFNKYEPIFDKAGLTYELAVRREVRELKGASYARSFRIANLAGLARISSPKEIDNNLMPVQDWNSHVVLQKRINQLAKTSIYFIPQMIEICNNADIQNKKWHILSKQLSSYNALESESDQISFLESEPLGLMAFSCGAYNDNQSFGHTLECDVRGEVTVRQEIIQVTVGEIKSGKDRKKAIVQCLKRLCIVGLATRLTFQNVPILDLQGEIFTPLTWDQVSQKEVREGLAEYKLVLPANGNIHIKIIHMS